MPQLNLTLLGSYQLAIDQQPFPALNAAKVRALLAYLVIESDRPHGREALGGLLWSDQPEDKALHSLRQALSSLRRALEDEQARQPFILIERDTVQFNPDSDYTLDVKAFQTHLRAAYQYFQGRAPRGAIRFHALQRASLLYRGPFLGSFYLPDSALFEEWALIQREALNRQAVEAFSHLLEYHERRGEYGRAREYALRLLDLAPWEESTHNELMRLYALDGQWSAAQNQYMTCRRYLSEHLGVEPSPETEALLTDIRRASLGAPHPRQEQPALPEKPGGYKPSGGGKLSETLSPRFPPAPHNLPAALLPGDSRIIGREDELDQLSELLAAPDSRLVTLVGPGGVGKTRLALEAAREQVGLFDDGVYFVSLAAISADKDHPQTAILTTMIAEALGYHFTQPEALSAQLVNYLRAKKLLLLLDNFEHVLASVDLVVELLAGTPAVKILATSRRLLNLRAECVLEVAGLAYPAEAAASSQGQPSRRLSLAQVEAYPAVQLFVQCAQRLAPGFALAEEASAVARICQLLEGLPLGLELSAAWVRSHRCEAIARQIEQGLDFLATRMRDIPERHRSLRAVFEQSWRLLSPELQAVFRRLAIFRGGFSVDAARHIAAMDAHCLEALVDHSLIRQVGPGRYDLHSLVAQFTEEKLAAEDPGPGSARQAHAHYFSDFIAARQAALKSALQKQALGEIGQDFENIRRAWLTLVELVTSMPGFEISLAQSVESLYQFVNISSRFSDGIALLEQARSALEAASGRGDSPERALALGRVLCYQGALHLRLHEFQPAESLLTRSRAALERLEAGSDLAFCLVSQAGAAFHQGDPQLASRLARESLWLYQQAEDDWGQAYALYVLGLIQNRQGQFDLAQWSAEASLAACRPSGDQRRLIGPLNLLADILCHRGDYTAALPIYAEALETSRALGDLYNTAILLNNLGGAMQVLADYETGRRMFTESLQICRQIGDRCGEAAAHNSLSELEWVCGRLAQARQHAVEALALGRNLDDDWIVIIALHSLGEVDLAAGRLEEAIPRLGEALRLAWTSHEMVTVIRSLVSIAIAWLKFDPASASERRALALTILSVALYAPAFEQDRRALTETRLAEMGLTPPEQSALTLDLLIEQVLPHVP